MGDPNTGEIYRLREGQSPEVGHVPLNERLAQQLKEMEMDKRREELRSLVSQGQVVREITAHRINPFNVNVTIRALDGPGPGGASHHYRISLDNETTGSNVDLTFQKGPVKEFGVNGVSDEALFAILIDRLQGFQRGQYSCRENACALTKLEESLMWLHKRTLNREARNVEGTSAV